MTNRFTKYGCMIIAAVLLAGVLFAGAASADYVEVSTWDQLNTSVAEWNATGTDLGTRIVAVNTSILDRNGQNVHGIEVYGTVILTVTASPAGGNEAVINGNGQGRLFYVTGTGNLTIIGNVSSGAKLNVTGGIGVVEILKYVSAYVGGAVFVNDGGHLVLDRNALITNSTIEDESGRGGGIYVNSSLYKTGETFIISNGTFTMNGGSISGCSAGEGGAVYIYRDGYYDGDPATLIAMSEGIFTMNNGSISGCEAHYGGAVSNYGAFIMNNGSVSGCEAHYGGAVANSNTFIMNNGSISGCTATDSGGGVYVEGASTLRGVFTMYNASCISGCTAAKNGGGVYAKLSTFTMYNTSRISGCSATKDGGGVYVDAATTFIMNDASRISDCSADYGGGVYNTLFAMSSWINGTITGCHASLGAGMANMGQLMVSGCADITEDNDVAVACSVMEDMPENMYAPIYADPNTFAGQIANITLVRADIDIDYEHFEYIYNIADNPSIWVDQQVVNNTAGAGSLTNFTLAPPYLAMGYYLDSDAGSNLVLKGGPRYVNTWDELNSTVAGCAPGEDILVIVDQSIVDRTTAAEQNVDGIEVKGNVTIMANDTASSGDYLIDGKGLGRLFNVTGAGNLTLMGGSAGAILNLTNGNATVGFSGGAVYVNAGGNLTLAKGADITNSRALEYGGGVFNAGTFAMTGGNITDCTGLGSAHPHLAAGGGVYVAGSGVFTLTKGAIAHCTAYSGGGVYVAMSGRFALTEGAITHCTAPSWGGGVYVAGSDGSGGVFSMTGGNITDCEADCYGGVVSMNVFTMAGGNITNCKATSHGGGVGFRHKFTMTGGNITDCEADSYGGGVAFLVQVDGTFNMTGGKICDNTAALGAGVVMMPATVFNISGTAMVSDNDVAMCGGGGVIASQIATVTMGPCTATIANITLNMLEVEEPVSIVANASAWLGQVVVKNGAVFASQFALASAITDAGYFLNASGDDLILSKEPVTLLILNVNGGTGGSTSVNATHGSAQLDAAISNPTRNGYTFIGWFDDDVQGEKVIAANGRLVVSSYTDSTGKWNVTVSSMDLYAQWDANPEKPVSPSENYGSTTILTNNLYDVNFVMNGHGVQVMNQTVAVGSTATEPYPAPTADGFVFRGWYSDKGLTAKYAFSTPVTRNTELYAGWTAVTIQPVDIPTQQTSKSPAPFVGLIAGLGAAAVLLRMRK